MARKAKQTGFEKRMACLSAAKAQLDAREAAALALLHPDDAGAAYASAELNAYDTMRERGRPAAKAQSFAYRNILVSTLADIADCAEDYGFRRAA